MKPAREELVAELELQMNHNRKSKVYANLGMFLGLDIDSQHTAQ